MAIIGATSTSYAPTSTDAGTLLTVRVTGSRPGYTPSSTATAATAAVAEGILVVTVPRITGTVKVGSTLTANPGIWGPATVTLSYQWYRSAVAIIGASAATHRLTAADGGDTMTVRVTGSKTGYSSSSRTSGATAKVANGSLIAATPRITGTARVGSTLTANPGSWGLAPVTLRYHWYRSGVAIVGASAAIYKIRSVYSGFVVSVGVTGSKTGYATAVKTSGATGKVASLTPAPYVPPKPYHRPPTYPR